LSWPAGATNFVLETAERLAPGNWATVTNGIVLEAGTCAFSLPTEGGARFYRLRRVP
jgi:hypothetical protein